MPESDMSCSLPPFDASHRNPLDSEVTTLLFLDVCLQPAFHWQLTSTPANPCFCLLPTGYVCVSPSQLSGQLLATATQTILSPLLFSPTYPLSPLHSWALGGHGCLSYSSVGTGGSGRCKFFPFMWVNSQHYIKLFITELSV